MEKYFPENESDAKEIIKQRIQYARKEYSKSFNEELSNRKLAEKADISASYLDTIISGKKIPSLEKYIEICFVLAAQPEKMLNGLTNYIKSSKIKSDVNSPEYITEYYERVDKIISDIRVRNGLQNLIFMLPKDNDEIVYKNEDTLMATEGILMGSKITYKKLDSQPWNGGLYVIKVNKQTLIRRIWMVDDNVLLIPSTINSGEDLQLVPYKDVEEWGVIVSVNTKPRP